MKQELSAQEVFKSLEMSPGVLDPLFSMTDPIAITEALDEIKRQAKKHYLALCKKYHPDRNAGSEEKMKEINHAWDLFQSIRYQPPRPEPRRQMFHVRINYDGSWTNVDQTSANTTWPDF